MLLEKIGRRAAAIVCYATLCFVTASAPGTVRPLAAQACAGDCGGDGSVTVDEIITMVSIALGQAEVATCQVADPSGDGAVTVDEILQAVNNALNGCIPTGGCDTATVTVSLDFDPLAVPPLSGVVVDVNYPTTLVGLPGSGGDLSVLERIMDISGVGGAGVSEDLDSNSDGMDDRVRTSYLSIGIGIPPGGFENIQFDCEPGAEVPVPGDFTCQVPQASDAGGLPIEGVACSVEVSAP